MSFTVVVTDRAAGEIERAFDWWAENRSAEQASRWYQGIREAIGRLAETAESHPLAAEHAHVPYEIRELHFGLSDKPTHRVIFTILRQSVVILTLRHAAQKPLESGDLP